MKEKKLETLEGEDSRQWEIVDVNFGEAAWKNMIGYLERMADSREGYKENMELKKITTKKSKLDKIFMQQGKFKGKFMTNLEKYKKDIALE